MDRNSILGIVIIAAIMIVWGVVFSPNKKELEEQRRKQDSIALAIQNRTELDQIQLRVADSASAVKSDSAKMEKELVQYGEFAASASGENKFVTLENDLVKMVISTLGGRPYSVELKKYKTFYKTPVLLFSGDSTEFGLYFYNQNNPISTNNLYFTPGDGITQKIVTNQSDSVTMQLKTSETRYIEFVYSLRPGSYMVDFHINLTGMKDIGTRSPDVLDMKWGIFAPQQEQLRKNELQYVSLYYKPYMDDVESFNTRTKKELQEVNFTTKLDWIAFKDQFFSSVLIPDKGFENALIKMNNLPETDKYLKHFSAEIGLPFERKDSETITLRMYFGPNKFKLLNQYKDLELQELVTLGKSIVRWINRLVIIPIFDWLSKFIGNYGIIILLLTIIIKVGLLPLTYRSYLSQAKMRVMKPQIDELTEKYPKGKEMERQQATMALYKKAGVSPMGGCLPMLLQFPILYAMFRFFPTSIELRQESFLWATDLSTFDSILSWSANIPILSNIYGNHVSLFTILMTVSTIISMKMGEGQMASSTQMPGMKTMMYLMPVMFMFILNNFSAGLTYYYFLANVVTIGQNFLFKQFIDEEKILKQMEARKVKPAKKSRWDKIMDDMRKNQRATLQKNSIKKKDAATGSSSKSIGSSSKSIGSSNKSNTNKSSSKKSGGNSKKKK